ncbi:MAG: heavy metal translocating P-type ATPase [Isosphaeraceae bacterium]|nr:heavy metal translocating P-type ATPase [Isosphaeraceae bacterium]
MEVANRTIDLSIQGMTCGGCTATVERALSSLAGVESVEVELQPGRARIGLAGGADSVELRSRATAAIEAAGFRVGPPPASLGPVLVVIDPPTPASRAPASPAPSVPKAAEEWHYAVSGMHCAGCVARVESAFAGVPGVVEARVNFATERAGVVVDPSRVDPTALEAAVERAGYRAKRASDRPGEGAENLRRERAETIATHRRRLIAAILLTAPLVALAIVPDLLGLGHSAMVGVGWAMFLFATATQVVIGRPYYEGAIARARTGSTNMDTLIALGTSAAYLSSAWSLFFGSGHDAHSFMDAGLILTFTTLGKFLEVRSKAAAGEAIERLLDLAPKTARVVMEGREVDRPAADVLPGDLVRVRQGEAIPVDGTIVEGEADVDESMLTGEATPVLRSSGAFVAGGTRAVDGTLLVRAGRRGDESVLESIVRLVREAQASKAGVERLADAISARFVPVVLIVALACLLGWGIAGGDWAAGVRNASAVLIIACPCALGLATPMATAVASGRGARAGLLVRDASAFERLDRLGVIALDKTGTITRGRPSISRSLARDGFDPADLLRLAAGAERGSEHPIASAFADHDSSARVSAFASERGRGVRAEVDGRRVVVGSLRFLEETGIDLADARATAAAWESEGDTVLGVGVDGAAAGLVAVRDEVAPESREALDRLKRLGVDAYMLTGDNEVVAGAIARSVGLAADRVAARMSPEAKAAWVERAKQGGAVRVAMVGDGLNDAPALAAADLGITLGSGTDLAKATADVVIASGRLAGVPRAVVLGRATLRTIRLNLFWAFAYNTLGIPLAALGLFGEHGPLIAAAAMSLSSVTVVAHSALLARVDLDR